MTVNDHKLPSIWVIAARITVAVIVLLTLAVVGALCFMPLFLLAVFLLIVVIPSGVWIAWSSRRQRGFRLLCYLEQATRLNLPLPQLIGAAAASERGILAVRLGHLRHVLEKGTPISVAMSLATPELSTQTIGSVSFAEQIGRLPQVLRRLVEQHAAAIHSRQSTQRCGGIYPCFVLAVIAVMFSGVMVIIVPKFEKIFADHGVQLPAITRTMIGIGVWMVGDRPGQMLPGVLYVVLLVIVVAGLYMMRRLGGRWDVVRRISWYLPIWNRLVRDRAMADLCYGLEQSAKSGLPMHLAVEHVCWMGVNPVLSGKARKWHEAILDGLDQQQAARRAGMPDLVGGMLATARSDRDTVQVFEFLARYYDSRSHRTVTLILASVEPIVMLLIGAIVGFLVTGIFMPLVELIWATVNMSGT